MYIVGLSHLIIKQVFFMQINQDLHTADTTVDTIHELIKSDECKN